MGELSGSGPGPVREGRAGRPAARDVCRDAIFNFHSDCLCWKTLAESYSTFVLDQIKVKIYSFAHWEI